MSGALASFVESELLPDFFLFLRGSRLIMPHCDVPERVTVVTYDGRTIVVRPPNQVLCCFAHFKLTRVFKLNQGTIKGYDQTSNLILSDSFERIYSLDEPLAEEPLGLYIIRGDNMCVTSDFRKLCLNRFNGYRTECWWETWIQPKKPKWIIPQYEPTRLKRSISKL